MAGIRSLLNAAAVLLALATPVVAQDYPTKPVRIIVPFPPGGSNDLAARVIATQLSERLGKQFLVENRGGAGGVVGTELVAKSAPDGYTLLITSIAGTVTPWLYKLSFEPVTSFTPVSILLSVPTVLVVHPDLPVKSTKELIAMAKEKPGQLQYASSGIGASLHLAGELFKVMASVDILHVPFRGAGPAMIDVVGGHTKVAFGSVPSAMGHIRANRVRALGVGELKRIAALPDVPTIDEAGIPGYAAGNWIGLVAPAGTPPAVVARLHNEIQAILDTPEAQKAFANEGADVVRMSSAEFGAFMRSELAKWGKVVKEAGIKAQ